MKTLILYTSVTGNTELVAEEIYQKMKSLTDVHYVSVEQFHTVNLTEYDAVIVGTYTWDDGAIPLEMEPVYEAFEDNEVKHIITGVFGSGDSFYPNFCGAVDEFKNMLHVQTDLTVTLKVELSPQDKDIKKCEAFCQLVMNKLPAAA